MKNNDYIEKAKNTILNRVKFHAPILYDNKIDKNLLYNYGIDVDKPIFKFDKILNKNLIKAFYLAQKESEFNLVVSSNSLDNFSCKYFKDFKNLTYYNKRSSPLFLVEMINKLNINYSASSNYNIKYKDKFFKINGEILNPFFKDFELVKHSNFNGVEVDYSEFVLNGTNFYIECENKRNVASEIDIEINFPLKKGYYFFKKILNCIKIENLLTKETLFFNYLCKNAKFLFSNVDGLENSVFCCLNLTSKLRLKKGEKKVLFFNFGKEKYNFKNNQKLKKIKYIANEKIMEIFNLKIKSKNVDFDNYFNKRLPQKIWLNWLNWTVDDVLEKKYKNLKKMFIIESKSLIFVPFKEIQLKELGIFNGKYYKKVSVVSSDEKFVKVGKTCFFNTNALSNTLLSSKEPICLSFGG